ncbi:T-cell surface glycoprotein CD8 alpha chain [Varanus komodoensis]|uniref:T-cell surface glycoprotein CD8 alpha chain n=1 Tax=Varanus komodoensis TaxID=61221 RepID=UPI001CF7B88C|nr:T-cell surface glycoprotein CD8 alpha chain [Varanus komodoensis]
MARMSSFLWLFGLILGCAKSQANEVEIKMIKGPPKEFQTEVQLMCNPHYSDTGVYWVLQRKDLSAHFILHVSIRSKMTPEHKRGYKAERSGNYYQLTITSFEEENQGFYYCIVHRNQELYYSSGLEVYRQVQLTPTPTIPKQVSTRSKGLVTEKGMGSPSSETETQSLIKCELYIWVPLASGSLVLIILVIILSVCCGLRRRRKICRCKRPMDGANGKLSVPR